MATRGIRGATTVERNDRTEILKRSNLVRHLIDTLRSSYGQGDGEPFEDAVQARLEGKG